MSIRDSDIPECITKACADYGALPSAFASPVTDALAAIAELQRIAAALGPLVPLAAELRAERQALSEQRSRLFLIASEMQGLVNRLGRAVDALERAD